MKKLLLAPSFLCLPLAAHAQSAGQINLPTGFGVISPATLSAAVNSALQGKRDATDAIAAETANAAAAAAAQGTANAAVPSAMIGVANGVLGLDSTGHASLAQLPTIPASQTTGLLPLTGGTVSGALVGATSVSTPLYVNDGNVPQSGGTLNRWLNFTGSTGGFYSGGADGVIRVNLSDYAAAYARINPFQVIDAIYGISGNRYAVNGEISVDGTPAVPGAYVGTFGQAQASAPSGTYNPIGISGFQGTNWGGDDLGSINSGAANYYAVIGREVDQIVAANTAVGELIGADIVNQGSGGGIFVNDGISIDGGDAWKNGLSIGTESTAWPILPGGQGNDSAIIRAVARMYSNNSSNPANSADWGVDFRSVAFGQYSLAMPDFSVDPQGNAAATSLSTSHSIQAQTATVTGVSITNGGIYSGWPAFTVSAPPTGGTTATVTVATVDGVELLTGFGATGSGYVVGDLLTYTGGTGTPPTFVVATVNSNGGITGLTLPTAGTANEGTTTSPPTPSTPLNLTGGTGTGAQIVIGWKADFTNSVYQPASVIFTATGAGYVVNDVITLVGDTGTEPTYTVTAVTAQGGITATTLATAGSLTALSGTSVYQSVTGGTGTGASVMDGVGIASFTNTSGSGYSAGAPPILVPSYATTGYVQRPPLMAVTMTDTAQPLVLNPNGGDVAIGPVGPRVPLVTTATSGFIDLPYTSAAPTGTPANAPASCEINTGTHTLNCFMSGGWYHVTMTAGAD